MRNSVLIRAMALLIFTSSAQSALALEPSPAPVSRKALLGTCLNEAEWLITHTAQYQNGSSQTKRKMKNSSNPEVIGLKTVCAQMNKVTSTTSAALLKQCTDQLEAILKSHGDEAADHVARMSQICRDMTTL